MPFAPIGKKVAKFSGVGVLASRYDDENVHEGGAVGISHELGVCGLLPWVGWRPGCFPGLNFGMLGGVGGGVGGNICRHGWRSIRGGVLLSRLLRGQLM